MARTTTKQERPDTIAEAEMAGDVQEAGKQVAHFNQSRLPYADVLQERFGVDRSTWTVLTESIWPNAKSVNSIAMAIAYCRARKLDPLKKPVHIVPMWNSAVGKMVETIWPSIAEIRTTAHRTSDYAGIDAIEWGPDKSQKFTGEVTEWGEQRGQKVKRTIALEVTFPEWARYTVYRMVAGVRVKFVGPQVYWVESFAEIQNSGVPNSMWGSRRTRGQLDKVAEAAALRRAFPEELGNTYAAEEMEGRVIDMADPNAVVVPDEEKPAGASGAGSAPNGATPALPAQARPPKAPARQQKPAEEIEDAEVVEEEKPQAEAPTEKWSDTARGYRDRIAAATTKKALAALGAAVAEDALTAAEKERLAQLIEARVMEVSKEPAAPKPTPGVDANGKVVDDAAFYKHVDSLLAEAKTIDALSTAFETRVSPYRGAMSTSDAYSKLVDLYRDHEARING